MSSPKKPSSQPSSDAADDASDAEVFFFRGAFIMTTSLLQGLAARPIWETAPFSVSDVIAIRRAIKISLRSLNQIESALDKRE